MDGLKNRVARGRLLLGAKRDAVDDSLGSVWDLVVTFRGLVQ